MCVDRLGFTVQIWVDRWRARRNARNLTQVNDLAPGNTIAVRDPEDGRALGTWTLRGRLAKGGQGVVHTVEDGRGRLGVLKVPSAQGLIAMEVERRILLKLPPHRNIVRVLGIATIRGTECPVFAYAHQNPYVRLGRPEVKAELSRHAWGAKAEQRVGLPATTAIEMVQELSAALEHIHRHGFVHGDLKPANLLVEIDSDRAELSHQDYFEAIQRREFNTILVDFGSTRGVEFLDDHDEEDMKIVPSEFTPLYAPPEAFEGGKLGTAVDVYQLGLLLYQFITGRTPFEHHVRPQVRRVLMDLSPELLALKRKESAGKLHGWDRGLLEAASLEDVFFAESYQSPRLRERFCADAVSMIEAATRPKPADRPTMAAFRADLLRLFELEPPRRGGKGRAQVSLSNPRWHLRRTNRLARAAQALDGLDLPKRPKAPPPKLEPKPQPKSGRLLQSKHDPTAATTSWEVAEAAEQAADAEGTRPGARVTGRLARRAPVGRSPLVGPLTGVRVALIDDDKVALAVLGKALRKRGCKVGTFRDPESALEVVARDQPDALIVDMQMPGITGPELVRRLIARLNVIPFPVLVLSSLEREEALQEAFRAGVSDYLVKPCSEGELAVKLEQALTKHQASPLPEVPLELGGFEVGEELCRGELGSVYQARDPWNEAQGDYAIKVLRPEFAGEAMPLLQLRREINVLAAVDHPSVPQLVKSGLLGGLLFYVTGQYPLLSLGQEVRETGKLGPDEVWQVLTEIGGALVALHADGWCLTRLTPEGLGRNDAGRIMLTDLAHARRHHHAAREDEPALTRSRYAPPEHYLDPPVADYRGDVYALGAVALELYAGRPAVRARGTQRVDVAGLGAGLPIALLDLLEGMLEPDLARRLSSQAVVGACRR